MRRNFLRLCQTNLMCRNFLRIHFLFCYKVNSNLAQNFQYSFTKKGKKIFFKKFKSLKYPQSSFQKTPGFSKKTQGISKKPFQKTQCFGGYQPQLASKKLFNKQACPKLKLRRKTSVWMNFSAKSVNLILVSEILSFWTHLLEVFLENLLEFFSKCPKKPAYLTPPLFDCLRSP